MIKIRFRLNKKLDYETCKRFISFSMGGINFRKLILKDHPKLENIFEFEKMKAYIDDYYEKHIEEIKNKRNLLQKEWNRINDKIIINLEKIFGVKFKKGKYIGFLSIFNCNPRFLHNKTFQVFYKMSTSSCLIISIHELIHFIYFDAFDFYIKKHNLNEKQMWDLSEIIDCVILNDPRIKNMFPRMRIKIYPFHQKFFPKFNSLWYETKNFKSYLFEAIKLIERIDKNGIIKPI